MDAPESQPVFTSLWGPLQAIGAIVLPGQEALDEDGWCRAQDIIEHALAARPPGVKRQIRLFLRLVNLLPLLTTGRTFQRLSVDRRAAILGRLQRSRLLPIRRGVWGIRTLLFMGYYLQEPVRGRIGYRAQPGGWMERGPGGPAQGDPWGNAGNGPGEAAEGTAEDQDEDQNEGAT